MRIFLMIVLMLVIGCSPAEIRKVVFGTSLHDVNVAEKKYTKIVAAKPSECFIQVLVILKKRKAIIEKSDSKNNFIVAYGFNDFFKSKDNRNVVNTTEVGILFKEASEGKTEIILVCDDYRLGTFIADEIFKKLENK
jgi:hypothetical protein